MRARKLITRGRDLRIASILNVDNMTCDGGKDTDWKLDFQNKFA